MFYDLDLLQGWMIYDILTQIVKSERGMNLIKQFQISSSISGASMKRIIPAVVLICLLTVVAVLAADKGAVTVPAGAKCPVCGMFVAKYPNWSTTARFKDGTTSYYDGPKDMFIHYLDTARYTPENVRPILWRWS